MTDSTICIIADPALAEHYVIENDQDVLYLGHTCVLATRSVAALIDTRRGHLITHGDPASVSSELAGMRTALWASRSAPDDRDWLRLEGHLQVDTLKQALGKGGEAELL